MANYTFRTLEDRKRIQRLWSRKECTAREVAEAMHLPLVTVYNELRRGQDGVTRLPDQRLKYDANLAQLRMHEAFARRGRRKVQTEDNET